MVHPHHKNVPSKHLNIIMQVKMNMKRSTIPATSWSSCAVSLRPGKYIKLSFIWIRSSEDYWRLPTRIVAWRWSTQFNCSRSHKRIVANHAFRESLNNCMKSSRSILLSLTHMIQACQIFFNVQSAVCHTTIAILQDEINIYLVTFIRILLIQNVNKDKKEWRKRTI